MKEITINGGTRLIEKDALSYAELAKLAGWSETAVVTIQYTYRYGKDRRRGKSYYPTAFIMPCWMG